MKQPELMEQQTDKPAEQKVETLPALRDETTQMMPMIERLAALPDFDVAKLEKLIDMQERILDRNAKAAFDAAFSRMQPELPEIDENGAIRDRDGKIRSRYAKLEDIQKAIKPILARHGFAIRHRTEFPTDRPGIIRVVGILTHGDGHAEESVFESKADENQFRTAIQSEGSTVSYGRRYTTIDLLNITTRGKDNDGQGDEIDAPDGYDAWFAVLDGIVAEGPTKLDKVFGDSPVAFKNFTVNHRKVEWADMKRRAAAARRR